MRPVRQASDSTALAPSDRTERIALSETSTPADGEKRRRRTRRRRAARERAARRYAAPPLLPGWLLIVLIALLGVATWMAGDPEFRVTRAHEGLIDEVRSAESARWVKKGTAGILRVESDGAAVLVNEGKRAVVFRLISVPAAALGSGQDIRLRGRVERLGPATFFFDAERNARVFLRWLDEHGTLLGYGGGESFSGQFRTHSFETVIEPPAGVVAAELVLRLKSPGAWRLHDVTIDAVRLAPGYAPVRIALIGSWALLFGLLLYGVFRRVRGRAVAILGGVLVALVTGVAFSQSGVSAAVGPLVAALSGWLPPSITPSGDDLLGGGHAIGFGALVLALLAVRRALGLNAMGVLVLGIVLAFATEALQRHRPNRTPELADVGVDLIGMLVALCAWGGYVWLEARQRKARVAGAEMFLPAGAEGSRHRSRSTSDTAGS